LAACELWVKNGLIANLVTIALEREPTQRGAAVALIVMGQSAPTPALQRQPRLGAVQGLDLAFLVN